MGKCIVCGTKIRYNRFEKISGKIYCLTCAKKMKSQLKLNITPNEAAKEAMLAAGINFLLKGVDDGM